MDFGLSEEQQLLVETVDRYLAEHCPLDFVREAVDETVFGSVGHEGLLGECLRPYTYVVGQSGTTDSRRPQQDGNEVVRGQSAGLSEPLSASPRQGSFEESSGALEATPGVLHPSSRVERPNVAIPRPLPPRE